MKILLLSVIIVTFSIDGNDTNKLVPPNLGILKVSFPY